MELQLRGHDIPIHIGVHRLKPDVDSIAGRFGVELHDRLEVGDLLIGVPLEQLEQDRFLGLEVRVDGPLGVTSFSGDHVNGGAAKTMSGENLSRSHQQPFASLRVAFCAREPDPLVHDTHCNLDTNITQVPMGAPMASPRAPPPDEPGNESKSKRGPDRALARFDPDRNQNTI